MSEREEIECALEECEVRFTPRVHNQRFHDRECCRIYTNARILAAYHEKRNKKMTGRICKHRVSGKLELRCGTILSRYNPGELCAVHEVKAHVAKLEAWGWELDSEGEVRF